VIKILGFLINVDLHPFHRAAELVI
jgi:hypothetical protein